VLFVGASETVCEKCAHEYECEFVRSLLLVLRRSELFGAQLSVAPK